MSEINKCKSPSFKPKDYYGYLAYEYISKHTDSCPDVNNKSSDLDADVPSEIFKERQRFTIGLVKIHRNLLQRSDQLGLRPKRHPHPTTLKKVQILTENLDAFYRELVKHLDSFQRNSSKRLNLRKKIEAKILTMVEMLESIKHDDDEDQTSYGNRSSYYSINGDCDGEYMKCLHDSMAVMRYDLMQYVLALKEQKTVWQKVWGCFSRRRGENSLRNCRRSYNRIV